MGKIKINIKPLSVNGAFQGRKFKTPAYKVYEKALNLMLPKIEVPEGKLKLTLRFGFSSVASDWDNPIKPFQDILQKKYGFNDKNIHQAVVSKELVPKGQEFIEFELTAIEQTE